ncbi:SHOCT domain-containing protein [Halorarum halophilum]|uniref:SHOCT domain-containing protein n=1 Tax=Halorarum halophilum TaxID=2743090 RepID=A0A7D5KVT8_9EURY|nr:SHOCT domain-containing protein [Halobaculum halophilum]QLG29420.1 SHOCT domain-containing protein [Halobaculum halophilum]
MGFWEKAKEEFEKGKKTVEEAAYTQEYSVEQAEKVANEMRNEVNPETLRMKKMGKAPLDWLDEGEKLVYFLNGFDLDIDDNDEGYSSQLLVTDKKVIMLASSITGKRSQYTVLFEDIIGLSVQRRVLSHIRIQTAGHSYKISAGGSAPGLADEVVDYIRQRKEEIGSEGDESSEESALDKLERLADLRDRGVVTEKEFERKKDKLMEEI